MACDPNVLTAQAACVACIPDGMRIPVLISLLCQIRDNGGTGGGTPALPTNQIFVGNASNQAAAVPMSGDATIVASGALTLANTAQARTDIGLGTTNDVTFKSQTSNFHRGTEVSIAAASIDWSLGEVFTKTLVGNITFTFANVTSGRVITVIVVGDGVSTVTWPVLTWPGGVAPVQTAGGVAKTDIYTFVAVAAGTVYGSAVSNMS